MTGDAWVEVGERQSARVAEAEKALLDLIYLRPGGDDPLYLRELRLQSLERLKKNASRAGRDFSPCPRSPAR